MITIIMDQLVHQALMMIDIDSNDDERMRRMIRMTKTGGMVYYQAKTKMKRL